MRNVSNDEYKARRRKYADRRDLYISESVLKVVTRIRRCPCKLDTHCPCPDHLDEIHAKGSCHCGLFSETPTE